MLESNLMSRTRVCSRRHRCRCSCHRRNHKRNRARTRRRTRRGGTGAGAGAGAGCGSTACPISPFSWKDMNQAVQVAQSSRGGSSASASVTDTSSLKQSCGVTGCNAIYGTAQNGGEGGGGAGAGGGRKKKCGCSLGLEGLFSSMTGTKRRTRRRRRQRHRRGGGSSFYRAPAPIPGPFVGSPWGASLSTWPAVDGISGNRNYLPSVGNVIDSDPTRSMQLDDSGYGAKMPSSMVGGYSYEKKESTRRPRSRAVGGAGGQIVPPSTLDFGVRSIYNTLNAIPRPVNPLPYKDQLTPTLKQDAAIL